MIWIGKFRSMALAGLSMLILTLVFGCAPSGPGLDNKPPPPGGPKSNARKPPGEMNKPEPTNH